MDINALLVDIGFTISSELLSRNKLDHALLAVTMHTLQSLNEDKQLKLIHSSQ